MGQRLARSTAPSEERQRLERLALSLAEETGDEKLHNLLHLAILCDDESAPAWRGSRRMTPEEMRQSRANRWMRVWAHLAGHDVAVMGSNARGLGDGIAWLVAQVSRAPGLPPREAENALMWEIHPEPTGVRIVGPACGPTRAWYARGPKERHESPLTEHLGIARGLAGQGWAETSWGEMGSETPRGSWQAPLPARKQSAARVVREQVAEARAEARVFVARARGEARMRLEHHLRQVVVYLVHHGWGALERLGWRRTAQVVLELDARWTTRRQGWDDSADAIALNRDYEAALRLVELARARPAPYRQSADPRQR